MNINIVSPQDPKSYTPSLHLPERAFHVQHTQNLSPYQHPPTQILASTIGIYPSMTSAQTAALTALLCSLRECVEAGWSGTYCADIDLWKKGLVTMLGRDGNGREVHVPVHEVSIGVVEVWDGRWAPEMGDEEEKALFEEKPEERVVVKLPGRRQVAVSVKRQGASRYGVHGNGFGDAVVEDWELQFPRYASGPMYDEELSPHWPRTRAPHFRRDELSNWSRAVKRGDGSGGDALELQDMCTHSWP